MSVNRLTLLLSLLLASSLAVQAQDAALQPLASIRAAAEKAVRDIIDPGIVWREAQRHRAGSASAPGWMQQQTHTFAPAPRHTQSRVPVRVSCAAPSWTMNVPVEIRRTHQVLLLKRAVGRGEAIAPRM